MEIKLNEVKIENLSNINITLNKNEITSIIGKNDSLKQYLIESIAGIKKIDNGFLKYGRKKIEKENYLEKIEEVKKEIYYLKSDYQNILFNINIKEDLIYYLGKYNEDELNELLLSFNLESDILNEIYIDLDSSNYKKICLIIALLSDANTIIIEEPTIDLDYKSIQTLIKQLKRLKRKEKTIVISSNNMDFVLEVTDKIITIENNKVVENSDKYQVLSNEEILNNINANMPKLIQFVNDVKRVKNIKLSYKDNVNDLIKEIYRHAK